MGVAFRHVRALSPFGPIFAKELVITARRKRTYWLRVGYLSTLLMLLLWAYLLAGSFGDTGVAARQARQSEMGHAFFSVFAMFSVIAMGLIGPVLTATAVNSERLRKTLAVLLMTPITSWQIVSGKLFSRLLIALTLLGLSVPVLAVVRLVGSVEIEQMFAVICLCAVAALASAAVGLFYSTLINRAYAVILLSYLTLGFFYLFLPLFGTLLLKDWVRESELIRLISIENPYFATGFLLAVSWGGRGLGQGVPWEWCCYVHLGVSAILLLLSARLVRRREKGTPDAITFSAPALGAPALSAPPIGRPMMADSAAVAPPLTVMAPNIPLPGSRRPRGRERTVWDNPVLWREAQRPLFGRVWQRVVTVAITLLLLLWSYGAAGEALGNAGVHAAYGVIFLGLLILIACVLSATAIAQEKESDTWTLLLASPLSGKAIVLGKLLGIYRRMFWPGVLVVVHFAIACLAVGLSPRVGDYSYHYQRPFHYGVWTIPLMLWIMFTALTLFVATGLYFSLRLRSVTLAIILNLSLPIVLYAVVPLLAFVVGAVFSSNRSGFAEVTLLYSPFVNLVMSTDSPELPVMGSTTGAFFVQFMLAIGACYLIISGAIIGHCIYAFDHVTGRNISRKR